MVGSGEASRRTPPPASAPGAGHAPGGVGKRNPSILSFRTKDELVDFVAELFRLEGSAPHLGVNADTLRGFIRKVSQHYRANPYHNFHHASDTVNTIAWMLSRPVLRAHLPVHHRFLLMLTALIHDVEHPGHNNQWEVQTQSTLAQKYENVAVLEKHSFDVTLKILGDPAYDLLRPFGMETARAWLRIVEHIVLATDFAAHRQFLDDFREYLATHPRDFADDAFASWVCRALMKAADIANVSKPFPQAQVWGQRVMMEFWAQGVMEKRYSLPVGPLNDPETVQINAAQAGFIRFAALDLFELLRQVEPEVGEMVEHLRTNMSHYEEKARQGDGAFE